MSKATILLVSFVLVGLAACGGSQVSPEPETLRVAIYSYVPLGRDLFVKLKTAFEATRTGVTVEIVESRPGPGEQPISLATDYYQEGLLKVEADIYEIDTVLLPDMITKRNIVPITLPKADFVPEARQAVQFGGTTWAAPHSICGNVLFYRVGDTPFRTRRPGMISWASLARRALGSLI